MENVTALGQGAPRSGILERPQLFSPHHPQHGEQGIGDMFQPCLYYSSLSLAIQWLPSSCLVTGKNEARTQVKGEQNDEELY